MWSVWGYSPTHRTSIYLTPLSEMGMEAEKGLTWGG